MSGAGFDWLNLAALKSDTDLPPPPVSFGVTPTSSTSSLNLVQKSQSQSQSQSQLASRNASTDELVEVPETEEDLQVPLSLSANQLTPEEAKTYLRWYNDIVVRKGTKLIRLHDVFQFLNNFNLPPRVKKALEKIFRYSVSFNIGEFFACLRVIAHTILANETPRRLLIKKPGPLLTPRSILCGKRKQESDDDEDDDNHNNDDNELTGTSSQGSTLDIDSFTKFILTGSRPEDASRSKRKHKARRVKFSDEVTVEPSETTMNDDVEPVKIDMSLPMDQLLKNMPLKSKSTLATHVNEEEELKEMQDQINHFQDVKNVDSALIHGVPANIPQIFFDEVNNPSPSVASPDPTFQQQQSTPQLLAPNHTGPVPFGNALSPNITGTNGYGNGNGNGSGYLSPNFTGQQQDAAFLQPTMTGSLSNTMRQHIGLSLQHDPNTLTPPVPPPRSRSSSSPIPFQSNPQLQQQQPSIEISLPLQQPQPQPQAHSLGFYQQRTSSPLSPPPPPPPPSRRSRSSSLQQPQHQLLQAPVPPPPPPPSRSPVLPPKIPFQSSPTPYQSNQNGSIYDRVLQDYNINGVPVEHYNNNNNNNNINGNSNSNNYPYQTQVGLQSHQSNQSNQSDSTVDILGDLKALQSEVNRLQQWPR